MSPDLDRTYARFRRHGRHRDLARIFDATAPDLLLVASQICPDLGLAEDAVQNAFLQLIEGSARAPGAPLRPWLLRVAANRARDQMRRRRGRQDLAEQEIPAADPGPEQSVQDAELEQLVERAIRGLPEPQRMALLLNLLFGLGPTHIARVLGQPPATVRSWLHRGRAELRGRLAKSLSLAALPGRGLAAVRQAVLAGAPAGGVLGMKLLLAAAGVMLCTWVTWDFDVPAPEDSPRLAARSDERAAPHDTGSAGAASDPADAAGAARRVLAQRRGVRARRDDGLVSVTGVVVDTAGHPVPDVILDLRPPRPGGGRPRTIQLAGDQSLRSDARGALVPARIRPGHYRLVCRSGQVLTDPSELALDRDSEVRILTEAGSGTVTIRGHVLGPDGEAVAGATLRAWGSGLDTAVSAADGSFTIRRSPPLAMPRAQLSVRGPTGYRAVYVHPDPVSWGAAGIRVELPRAVQVHVLVVDGRSERPVERFAISRTRASASIAEAVCPPARVQPRCLGGPPTDLPSWRHTPLPLRPMTHARHVAFSALALTALLPAQNPIAYPQDSSAITRSENAPLGFTPFPSSGEARYQVLIPAAFLPSGGVLITGLEVVLTSGNAAITYQSLKITLGHTTNQTLSTTFSSNLAGAATVYTASNATINYTRGVWTPISFTTPFLYDGSRNLTIEFQKVLDNASQSRRNADHAVAGNPVRTDLPPSVFVTGAFNSGVSTAPIGTGGAEPIAVRLRVGRPTLTVASDPGGANNKVFALGTTFTLTNHGTANHRFANAFSVGLGPAVPVFNGRLHLTQPVFLLDFGTIAANGQSALSVPIPTTANIVGLHIGLQSLHDGGGALVLTNATDFFVND